MTALLRPDHLVVAARTLQEGRAHVESTLGVTLEQGGQHDHYGTHNLLLGLDDGLYLEVIAIDPDAPAPGRARWFALDAFDGAPRLHAWVCRAKGLRGLHSRLPGAPQIVPLRRGALAWDMAVAEDGALPFGGAFPLVLDWGATAPPAGSLRASGCRLDRLVLAHPEAAALRAALAPLLDDARVVIEAGRTPALRAEFTTPAGQRVLK